MPKPVFPNYFFALRFDTESSMSLQDVQGSIPWPPDTFSLLELEQFHLTLRFLGPLAFEDLEPYIHILRTIAEEGIKLPRLSISKILSLPSRSAARVVAAQIDPCSELFDLAAHFDTDVSAQHKNAHSLPSLQFLPHITLARLKHASVLHPLVLQKRLEPVLQSSISPFEVHAADIALLRTERADGQTSYVPVATQPLL